MFLPFSLGAQLTHSVPLERHLIRLLAAWSFLHFPPYPPKVKAYGWPLPWEDIYRGTIHVPD